MIDRFGGVKIKDGMVIHRQGRGPVAGARATVDTAGDIDRRITASRLLLTGPFAFGLRKKKDNRELYLTVEGEGFAFVEEVDPKKGKQARAFAARLNTLAQQQTPSPSPPPPPAVQEVNVMDQLRQLSELRDSGVITAEDFEAKKAELLGRL